MPNSSDDKVILVYNDKGVENLNQLLHFLRATLPYSYPIKTITAKEVKNADWEKNCKLFIIPGGADRPYSELLNGAGNQKIRQFVENGGSYLGICAGSYYGTSEIEFDKGGSLEVCETRELAFYPDKAIGPILAEYDYESKKGARAAVVEWVTDSKFEEGEKLYLYCNGGGYFYDAHIYPEKVKILANYDVDGEKLPAIVECAVGKGKVILSGVHFEYDPFSLDDSNDFLQKIIPDLRGSNKKRLVLAKYLLGILLE